MSARSLSFRCLGLGLLVTAIQVVLVISFAHPEGSLTGRYLSLVQHDSYWFANIIERGYGTTVPPIDHKEMEVSNVAFFPAYPVVVSLLKRATGLSTSMSLLLVAQLSAWGFWTYFFLFCQRWGVSLPLQVFGALAIAVHPAAFYLVAGYSESMFLMALSGFIYWSTQEGARAPVLAIAHGFTASATRIVGLPCAAIPVVLAFIRHGFRPTENWRSQLGPYRRPILIAVLSTFGGIAFFVFCQLHWGRWDLYMLTQNEGWGIEPDYLAAFKTENYRFALPPADDPTRASQFTSALAGVFFLVIAFIELVAAWQRRSDWHQRFGFYFAAAIIYYISLAGVASVQMESMLRYDLCVHALIVLGILHFLRQLPLSPTCVRAIGMGAASVLFAAALGLQSFYVWTFTQGNWVA